MRINAFRVRLGFVIGIAVLLTGRFLPCQSLPESRLVHIDKPFVQSTFDSLTEVIRREYVDADVASRVETYLRKRLAEGRYQLPTGDALAQVLTQDLFDASHDKHLFVTVSTDAANATAVIPQEPPRKETARFSNFGIQRVEILSGNIGYLNLTSFYRLEEARESFVSAMQVLAHADALVLDLRGNKGGSPDMAVFVASFMLDKPGIPLFSVMPRSGGEPMRFVTVQTPPPGSNADRILYILTSQTTWSAGEGLAFLLQERHRAEIIGETTAGAANPGRPYRVNALFEVNVPNGRVTSAVLGRNWEGVGVVPDVPASATDALDVAHARALRRLLDLTPKGWQHDELERELQALREK
jgi:C-terminal processing protease CtpA/Prc